MDTGKVMFVFIIAFFFIVGLTIEADIAKIARIVETTCVTKGQ